MSEKIVSKPSNEIYRQNWERIFGEKKEVLSSLKEDYNEKGEKDQDNP